MAYRLSVWIVVFLLSFNGGAVMLTETGAAEYMGIGVDVGDTSELDDATDDSEFDTGTGTGQTLFGTYNQLSGFLNGIFNAIMPGAEMLKNAFPDPTFALMVNFIFSVLAIIPTIDLAKFIRGQ